MKTSERARSLPEYMFAELDRRLAAKRAEGVDVISLGVGDPDTPTPPEIIERLREAALDPSTHRYPSYTGMPELRRAIADYYRRRFGVELDPDTEVLPLVGSKEGLVHLALAFLDPGDRTLVPDPGYPVYEGAAIIAGATPEPLPLSPEGGFLPDLDAVNVAPDTRMLWLNYPSNPTAAVARPGETFERAVDFARAHDLLLVHDAAYTDITFDGYTAPSVLQAPGAREIAVEFGSMSKGFNMTGWRIGWMVGAPEAVRALGSMKTRIDSGIPNAIQLAAIEGLTGSLGHFDGLVAMYQKRRDRVVSALNSLGWDLEAPLGSIYVWAPTPGGRGSEEFCADLLDRTGVVVAPGSGYGRGGEGYFRISLTVPDDRLEEALDRVERALS